MANHGPSYGLSRECALKSAAKFDAVRALQGVQWVEAVLGKELGIPSEGFENNQAFHNIFKNGSVLCELINALRPGTVKKINTLNTPFKHRENIEMYLKGCEAYGLKAQDLFQVNDLYEAKNLYMVIDNLFGLGGMAQKNGYSGPALGVKVASENKRTFDEETLKKGQSVIGLQYGTNKLASQAGMSAYGTGRQIRPEEDLEFSKNVISLQSGTNKGASQAGMSAYGTGRQIRPDGENLEFSKDVISLQSGTNKGASQAGMAAYGTGRQIRPDELNRDRQ